MLPPKGRKRNGGRTLTPPVYKKLIKRDIDADATYNRTTKSVSDSGTLRPPIRSGFKRGRQDPLTSRVMISLSLTMAYMKFNVLMCLSSMS